MGENDKRIKVFQIVPKLSTGGGEKVALLLAEHLPKNLFDVRIISLYPYSGTLYEQYAKHQNLQVVYLNKKPGFKTTDFIEISQLINSEKPHILHNHLYGLYSILPVLLKKNPKIKAIHTIHSMAENEAHTILLRVINFFAFKYLSVTPVSISMQVYKSVQRLYGSIYSPIIYNGIDIGRFFKDNRCKNEFRKQLDIPESDFLFVNVARFSPAKNQRVLLMSFERVTGEYKNCKLVLVGNGPLFTEMQNYAHSLGIHKAVLFLGERTDIPEILNASDCFVLSSMVEGFPLSVLEAMAAGKPVVSTNVGGVSEMITDGENGFLVPLGNIQTLSDRMLKLIKNRNLRDEMGNQGRKIVERKFDVKVMAMQYADLYHTLLNR